MGKKKDKEARRAAEAEAAPPTGAVVAEVAATLPPHLTQRPGRVLPAPPPGAPVMTAAREVVSRIAGSTLCYGEPVRAGDRAVIPAARVKARGGIGFGTGYGTEDEGSGGGSGGGGGGKLDAEPAGFIDIGPDGATYTAIPNGRSGGLLAGAALAAGAAAGVAGALFSARRRSNRAGLRHRLGR